MHCLIKYVNVHLAQIEFAVLCTNAYRVSLVDVVIIIFGFKI